MEELDWLIKKTPRSVDHLKLWPENPRLNPTENYLRITDFVEELTYESNDRNHFYDLVKSIADKGFVHIDPIVVWKEPNSERFFVAEGNRRVLALKLLRNPSKAPLSIRSFIKRQAEKVDRDKIEKIYVNVAPSFEDVEWYISQRNSISSLQLDWSRIQQQRWLSELYIKYNGDIDKISSITNMKIGELESFMIYLKIQDLVKEDIVRNQLSADEFEKATSYKFPITILERFFSNTEVKKRWGIEFNGTQIIFTKDKNSFLKAYVELVKRIIYRDTLFKDSDLKIDTRTITSNLVNILDSLPVVADKITEDTEINKEGTDQYNNAHNNNQIENTNNDLNHEFQEDTIANNRVSYVKNDPSRKQLILPIYDVISDSYRVIELFNELKKISFKYPNCISSSIRVFLDLAVNKYIETCSLEKSISQKYHCHIKDVTLKRKLEYLKVNCLKDKPKQIATILIDPDSQFSLNILNCYVHSQDSHFLNKQFLNNFWDFLFPLFNELIEINEIGN